MGRLEVVDDAVCRLRVGKWGCMRALSGQTMPASLFVVRCESNCSIVSAKLDARNSELSWSHLPSCSVRPMRPSVFGRLQTATMMTALPFDKVGGANHARASIRIWVGCLSERNVVGKREKVDVAGLRHNAVSVVDGRHESRGINIRLEDFESS